MRKTGLVIVVTLIPLMACEQSQQPVSRSIAIAPFEVHPANGKRSKEIASELQSLLSKALASNTDSVVRNWREVDLERATLKASATHIVEGQW